MKSISYEEAAAFGDPTLQKTNFMNIDLTVTEEKKIQKQISLPYFSKDVCYFMMITESETIICIKMGGISMGDEIERHTPNSIHYASTVARAVGMMEISESEFMNAYDEVQLGIEKAMFPSEIGFINGTEIPTL